MKKYLEIIISVFVLAIGISLPVAAQNATYSCGTYSAGDYSTNDCSEDGGGGDGGTTGDTGTDSSGEPAAGGDPTPYDDTNSEGDNASGEDEINSGKDPEGDVFSIIFAKLATSWGWLVLFGGLLVGGVVLIGLASRRRRD